MINSSLLRDFPAETILNIVPGLKDFCINNGVVKSFKSGDSLVEINQSLSHFILPINGDLNLINEEGVVFSILQKGRSLNLRGVLFNEVSKYAVQASQDVRVLAIERSDFVDYLSQFPKILKYFQLMTSYSSVRSFKFFLSSQGVDFNSIIEFFQEFKYVVNQRVVTFLEKNIILIDEGSVKIDFQGEQIKLEEGSWFGSQAITAPHRLNYTVDTDVSNFFIISNKYLADFFSDAPQVLEQLYNEPHIDLESFKVNEWGLKAESLGKNISSELSFIKKKFPDVNFDKLISADNNFESFISSTLNCSVFYKQEYNFAKVKSLFNKYRENLTILEVGKVVETLGFHSKPIVFSLKSSHLINFPQLCFIENRLVILFGIDKKSVYLHDPLYGFQTIDVKLIENLECLEVTFPDRSQLKKLDSNKYLQKDSYFNSGSKKYVKEFLQIEKKLLGKILFISILSFLVSLITPYISQNIIDEVIGLKDELSLKSYAIGLIFCHAIMTVLSYIKGLMMSEFSYFFDYNFSSVFYKNLLELNKKFFNDTKVGDVLARLGELTNVRSFFSSGTLETFINLIVSFVYAIILMTYSWKILLIPLVTIGIVFIIQKIFMKKIRQIYHSLFDAEAKTNSLISEAIAAMSTIKAFKGERAFSAKFDDTFLKQTNLKKKLELSQGTLSGLIEFAIGIIPIISIWVAVLMAFENELSLGEIFAINMYVSRVIGPLNQVVSFFIDIEELEVSFVKLDEVFEEEKEESKLKKKVAVGTKLRGGIRFDNVSFKYSESEPYVLKDLNFAIFPNQTVAIVGESGCGKTTVANLIAGGVTPTEGKIFYDNNDQDFLSLESIRSQIGFVQQKNDLFAGSIEENIAFTSSYCDEEKKIDAAKKSNSEEFIHMFPSSYNQYLAEGGMGLSGGQKQRLSIARTIYQDPQVLILDEATSALDSDSEFKVMNMFSEYMKNKTTVIIAHRYSTVRYADVVLVMEKGFVAEVGSVDELLEKQGRFFDLFKEQFS